MSLSRPCDSKNIGLSPLCDLEDPKVPNLFGNDIKDTYSDLVEGTVT